MPSRKQLIAAATLSTSLLGGGAVGALFGTPAVIAAQEAGEDSAPAAEDHRRRGGHRGHHGFALEAAADALGLTAEELRAELEDGATIADVAAARGVEVQALVDAVVADATARIDEKVAAGDLGADRGEQIKANLVDRVTALVNGEVGPGFGPGGHRHHRAFGRGAGLDAAAEALGLSADQLRDALAGGSSIADVAAERNVDVQVVIDAMVAAAGARLDEVKANLEERITALVNGERPTRPPAGVDS